MDYQMFKEQLAALLKRKAGDDFEVKVESVQKLNGIEKEAFVISRKKDWIAPTIYVELLYECCLQGVPLSQIAEKVLEQYRKVEAEARRPEKAAFLPTGKMLRRRSTASSFMRRKTVRCSPKFRTENFSISRSCTITRCGETACRMRQF